MPFLRTQQQHPLQQPPSPTRFQKPFFRTPPHSPEVQHKSVHLPRSQNPASNSKSRQSRIPTTLQAVFLASNRGKEVHKPPPEQVAYKVYFRNWLFQRNTTPDARTAGKPGVARNSKPTRSLFGNNTITTRRSRGNARSSSPRRQPAPAAPTPPPSLAQSRAPSQSQAHSQQTVPTVRQDLLCRFGMHTIRL
jgi:hypothetical protein